MSTKTGKPPQTLIPDAAAWQAMAAPLAAVPCIGPVMARGAEAQGAMMADWGQFWTHWLERRQEALESASRLASDVAPSQEAAGLAEAQKALMGWCTGSAQRVAADGREASEVAARCLTHVGDMQMTLLRCAMAFPTGRTVVKDHATPL